METTKQENIKSILKEIIANKLLLNIKTDEIDDNMSFYEGGVGLDSISIVNFIVEIEKQFGFDFSSDELNVELFNSINSLADFIKLKTA